VFKANHTVTSFIPGGCTGYIQPLDVSINKILKDKIAEFYEEYLESIPDKQLETNKFNIGERRVLVTRWVANAWEWLHREHKQTIVRTFRQLGITLKIDGSEDKDELRIRGFPDIEVGDWKRDGMESENCFILSEKPNQNTFDIPETDQLPSTEALSKETNVVGEEAIIAADNTAIAGDGEHPGDGDEIGNEMSDEMASEVSDEEDELAI
jgi:hypothetical protein